MFITLYGPNSYHRHQKTNEFISRYRQRYNGLSLKSFDFLNYTGSDSATDLANFIGSQSLFEPVKLGLVKNISLTDLSSLKKILSPLKEAKDIVLILSLDKKPTAAGLSFLSQSPNHFEAFPDLTPPKLKAHFLHRCSVLNLNLPPSIIDLILLEVGSDLWRLEHELVKLSHLGKPEPSLSDIASLGIAKTYAFFDALRALSGSDPKKRLTSLQVLLKQKEDPAKIFNLLASQKTTPPTLLADLDIDIKSGRLEYEEALLKLALPF